MATRLLIILGLTVAALGAPQSELKGRVSNCVQSEDLNSCLVQLFEDLRPYMSTGLPDYNVPVTEPMTIPLINLSFFKPPFNVKVVFTDSEISGLSGFIIDSIKADREAKTVTTSVNLPSMTATGNYEMTGEAFIPLDGSIGDYKADISGASLSGTAKLKVVDNRLQLDGEPVLDVDIESMKVDLTNLFGGDKPKLSESLLQLVNENPKQFVSDFRPEITKRLTQLIVGFYNSAIQDIDPAVFGL